MARPRPHLRKAPIVEAIIDLRVLRRDGVVAETFADLQPSIGANYTDGSLIQAIETRFGMEQGRLIGPSAVKSALGWQYKAPSVVVQFRINGFTFSRLEPYTTWDEVFGEAFRLWGVYLEKAQPLEVSRIAVRYINRLRVQGPTDLRQYLEAPPDLPLPIPQKLRAFLSRVLVEDSDRGASAVLVQALEESMDPSVLPLLIDIDAFREVALPPNDAALPGVFSSCVSSRTRYFLRVSRRERRRCTNDYCSRSVGTTLWPDHACPFYCQ